jgi:phosphate transport system permease protein
MLLFVIVFTVGSWHSIMHNGCQFFTSSNWLSNGFDDPTFGALNYIYGTLLTSAMALCIGGLASLGAAIFLAEYAPAWLRTPLSFLVELLAAVPRIVYGFWGVQFLSQLMGGPAGVERALHNVFGWLPLFADKVTTVKGNAFNVAFDGHDILVASLVLAVMIIPTIAAISRDVIRTVPARQREGMLALGATKWESVRKAIIPAGKRGIIGAIILGLGRALGETVAVAFLIGGASSAVGPQPTLLNHGETIASKFANNCHEISPADSNGYAAFLELSLVLFVITVLINGLARWLVTRSQPEAGQHHAPLARVGRCVGFLTLPCFTLLASPFITVVGSLVLVALWSLRQGLRAWKPGKGRLGRFAFLTNPSQSLGYRMFLDTCMQWLFVLALLVAIVPLALIFS